MSKVIQVTLEIVIFTAVIGVIATSITAAAANGNLSTAAAVLLGLVVLFVIIGFIMMMMKQMGVSTGR